MKSDLFREQNQRVINLYVDCTGHSSIAKKMFRIENLQTEIIIKYTIHLRHNFGFFDEIIF